MAMVMVVGMVVVVVVVIGAGAAGVVERLDAWRLGQRGECCRCCV